MQIHIEFNKGMIIAVALEIIGLISACIGIIKWIYGLFAYSIFDDTMQEFDELLIERSKKGTYWLHFAVRPQDNRRKVMFIQT